jgi:tetratricopeptide (TPR) repeat protein
MLVALNDIEHARSQYLKVAEIFDTWREQEQTVESKLALLAASNRDEKALHLYSQALYSWMTGSGKEIPEVLEKNIKVLEMNYGGTIYADEGYKLMVQAEKSVQDFVIRELDEAIKLATENKFIKAHALIDSLQKLRIPADTMKIIKVVADDVKEVEAEERIFQKRLKEEAVDAKWDQAVLFFDQKEYDKAIELFRELVNTSYRKKAIKKMNEAVEIAAVEMRKQAALLFSRSRRIRDKEQQLALLYESQAILQEIIRRYPEAEVIKKVSINLEVIEKQILELNPPQPIETEFEENEIFENDSEKHLKKGSESAQDIERE